MAAPKTEGNCYLCGQTLGKTAMKNHIMKEHAAGGEEECLLLKIEGAHAKEYWLFADMAKDKSLSTLDTFLRKIWLECCGHISEFRAHNFDGLTLGKTRKLGRFSEGDAMIHKYDMGSTTECLITIVGETSRPKQKGTVRLLARNSPPVFACASCGKPAELICQECLNDWDINPNYCAACAEDHDEHDCFLAITNSPRNGTCGYEGELDAFAFNPRNFVK